MRHDDGVLTDAWYVGFVPAPNRGVWSIASGRFGHCMAFRPIHNHRWLLVESNVWGLDCRTLGDDEASRLMTLCLDNNSLLYAFSRPRPQVALPAPLFTCASAIASLVGLRGWYFTPSQLYRALLREGSEVVSHEVSAGELP